MSYHMDIRLCDSNGRKKPANAIKIKHTKRELNVINNVCYVFFFKDELYNKFLLKSNQKSMWWAAFNWLKHTTKIITELPSVLNKKMPKFRKTEKKLF